MNVLVTGGAGYIGSHTVRRLCDLGHAVVVLDSLEFGRADAVTGVSAVRDFERTRFDGIGDGAAFTCAALKLECRIVMGYPGTNEAALAVIRGEADSIYLSDISALNFTKPGMNLPFYVLSRERTKLYPIDQAVKLVRERAIGPFVEVNIDEL